MVALASAAWDVRLGAMMKLSRLFALLVFIGLGSLVSAQEANPIFGPYEAIVYDHDVLQGVKVDGVGNVFIMFRPEKTGTQLILRISMAEGSQYREWFTGGEELIAEENTGRAPNMWTDRIQTSANYIEYWGDGKLFLHLKKVKG